MIYLDSHATTPVDPRVLEAMLPFFTEHYGNASSRNHAVGWTAGKAVERAREQVAALIGARFRDVIFTSGATESNNLAIKGVVAAGAARRHIVTVATEHRSVLDPCGALEREGFRITRLGVNADGLLDLQQLNDAISDDTLLVSVMSANNEIGVLAPVDEIAEIAHKRGALFHCDAVQSAGILRLDARTADVDLLSLSAHKLYGPKGVGALYIARRQPAIVIKPIIDGGGHERGLRSGTLNVPAIVGFGRAAELCAASFHEDAARLQSLRDRLWAGLRGEMDDVQPNGSMERRLPHNLNLRFDRVHGETLLKAVASSIAVSSGAACATTSAEPSHVLKAIGLSDDQARASIRFGLTRFTTADEIDTVVSTVSSVVKTLRRPPS